MNIYYTGLLIVLLYLGRPSDTASSNDTLTTGTSYDGTLLLLIVSPTATFHATFPDVPATSLLFVENGVLLPNTSATFAWKSLDEVDNSTGSAVLCKPPHKPFHTLIFSTANLFRN